MPKEMLLLREKALKEAGLSGKLLEHFNDRYPMPEAAAEDKDEPKAKGKKPMDSANEISIFGLICPDEAADFFGWLLGPENITTPRGLKAKFEEMDGDVVLRIDSAGGFIVAASDMIYEINKYDRGRVDAVVTGWAASAASLIMLQAERIEIAEFAEVMIHRANVGAFGNGPQLAEAAEDLMKTDNKLAKAYAKRTGKKPDEMLAYMDKETWFGADEAIEVGLCDGMTAKRTEKEAEGDEHDDKMNLAPDADSALAKAQKESMTYLNLMDLV